MDKASTIIRGFSKHFYRTNWTYKAKSWFPLPILKDIQLGWTLTPIPPAMASFMNSPLSPNIPLYLDVDVGGFFCSVFVPIQTQPHANSPANCIRRIILKCKWIKNIDAIKSHCNLWKCNRAQPGRECEECHGDARDNVNFLEQLGVQLAASLSMKVKVISVFCCCLTLSHPPQSPYLHGRCRRIWRRHWGRPPWRTQRCHWRRKNLKDNLERLVDDKPNLHETSAVEGALILL